MMSVGEKPTQEARTEAKRFDYVGDKEEKPRIGIKTEDERQ